MIWTTLSLFATPLREWMAQVPMEDSLHSWLLHMVDRNWKERWAFLVCVIHSFFYVCFQEEVLYTHDELQLNHYAFLRVTESWIAFYHANIALYIVPESLMGKRILWKFCKKNKQNKCPHKFHAYAPHTCLCCNCIWFRLHGVWKGMQCGDV